MSEVTDKLSSLASDIRKREEKRRADFADAGRVRRAVYKNLQENQDLDDLPHLKEEIHADAIAKLGNATAVAKDVLRKRGQPQNTIDFVMGDTPSKN